MKLVFYYPYVCRWGNWHVDSRGIQRRADIWLLGVLLFWILAGLQKWSWLESQGNEETSNIHRHMSRRPGLGGPGPLMENHRSWESQHFIIYSWTERHCIEYDTAESRRYNNKRYIGIWDILEGRQRKRWYNYISHLKSNPKWSVLNTFS